MRILSAFFSHAHNPCRHKTYKKPIACPPLATTPILKHNFHSRDNWCGGVGEGVHTKDLCRQGDGWGVGGGHWWPHDRGEVDVVVC